MPTFNMITWDAEQAYPDGTHAAQPAPHANSKYLLDKAFEIAEVVINGGTVLTTLPLAEPGRAVVLCYLPDAK